MKRAAILLAAAAISGIGVIPANAADQAKPPAAASSVNAPAKPAQTAKDSSATSAEAGIRTMLGSLTNDALSTKHMSQLVAYFDTAGRERVTKSASYNDGYGAKLDSQIEQLGKNWKQKYSHDFSVKNMADTFGDSFAMIRQGTPENDAQLASEVIKAAGENDSAKPLKDDKQIALAHVKADGALADLQVPLVCEKDGAWKLEAPPSLTADKLRQNMLSQLTDLNQHQSQWPANETDAYRQVSHRVLMAMMDKPGSNSNHASAKPHASKSAQTASASKSTAVAANQAATPAASPHRWWQFWHW